MQRLSDSGPSLTGNIGFKVNKTRFVQKDEQVNEVNGAETKDNV